MSTDISYIEAYTQHKQVADICNSNVFIGGKTWSFSMRQVPGLPICMLYPDGFSVMPEISARAKYPNESRPDVILTDPADETTNLLFTRTEDSAASENIPDIAQSLQTIIRRMQSGAIFHGAGTMEAELGQIGWFDYTSPAIDEDIYNLMFALSAECKVVLGGFCCQREYRKQWHPMVLQMLETIICLEDLGNG